MWVVLGGCRRGRLDKWNRMFTFLKRLLYCPIEVSRIPRLRTRVCGLSLIRLDRFRVAGWASGKYMCCSDILYYATNWYTVLSSSGDKKYRYILHLQGGGLNWENIGSYSRSRLPINCHHKLREIFNSTKKMWNLLCLLRCNKSSTILEKDSNATQFCRPFFLQQYFTPWTLPMDVGLHTKGFKISFYSVFYGKHSENIYRQTDILSNNFLSFHRDILLFLCCKNNVLMHCIWSQIAISLFCLLFS